MKGGAVARGLRRKASSLVKGMTPEALQRVLKLDNGWALQKQLLHNASHALAADTVLDLAKAVASATQHTMSEALLLLLAKLSKHSDNGSKARKDKADAALRENVRQLITDWDNAAQLPEDNYWATLEKLIADPGKGATSTGAHEVPPEHVLELSLETETFGVTAKSAVDRDGEARDDRAAARDGGRDAAGEQGGVDPPPPSRQHRHDPPPPPRQADRLRRALPPRLARRLPRGERAARRAGEGG